MVFLYVSLSVMVGRENLGLLDLELQLLDPVIALGSAEGLEGVLVALGSEDKLVGALGRWAPRHRPAAEARVRWSG